LLSIFGFFLLYYIKKGKIMPPKKRNGHYVGDSSYPNGRPVCKPIAPSRRIKPLEGPVHPGFVGKPPKPKKPYVIPGFAVRSEQNDELYKPSSSPRPQRKISPKRRPKF
jgi:hypothetical protein